MDILNDRELDALASSSGDDVDMASVKCVVREVRDLRTRLSAMEAVVEAAEELIDCSRGIAMDVAGYPIPFRLSKAIDAYRATKKEQSK